MTIPRYLLLCASLLLIGLSIGRGVKADALDDFYYACPPGGELRLEFRKMSPHSRLYVGCKNPETLATVTYYANLTAVQEKQIRSFGSKAISTTRTWSRPAEITIPILYESRSACDNWYLWATDEGKRAPKMTRAQKLRQLEC